MQPPHLVFGRVSINSALFSLSVTRGEWGENSVKYLLAFQRLLNVLGDSLVAFPCSTSFRFQTSSANEIQRYKGTEAKHLIGSKYIFHFSPNDQIRAISNLNKEILHLQRLPVSISLASDIIEIMGHSVFYMTRTDSSYSGLLISGVQLLC